MGADRLNSMLTLISAAETAAKGGINPYVVGAIALTISWGLVMGLMSFGKGREHS
jgi:hypothetical protein